MGLAVGGKLNLNVNTLFLTGATGILGAQILKQLLESFDGKVYCLVRATDVNHARTKILGFLKHYDPEQKLVTLLDQKVIPVLGDVGKPNLGLSDEEYRTIQGTVDAVLHVAALTSLFTTYEKVAPTNVGGTRNMVEFSLGTKNKFITYVSSYSVAGSKLLDTEHTISEKDTDIGQHFVDMAYQRSKFEAEAIVREASEQGLRWSIVRPGQIFGESTMGHYPFGQANVMGLFYDIFKTVIETGLAFESKWWFDVVPVDYVAQGAIHVCVREQRNGETYLLTNPDTKSYSEVVNMFRFEGYEIKDILFDQYRQLALNDQIRLKGRIYRSPTMFAFKYWFSRPGFDFSKSASADCSKTADILAAAGIHCAKLDQRMLSTYIHACQNANYFPKPFKRADSTPEFGRNFAGASL